MAGWVGRLPAGLHKELVQGSDDGESSLSLERAVELTFRLDTRCSNRVVVYERERFLIEEITAP